MTHICLASQESVIGKQKWIKDVKTAVIPPIPQC